MTVNKDTIGIAILSTDRPHCLYRLLKSIEGHSDANGLNVFVVDDSENKNPSRDLCTKYPWAKFEPSVTSRIGIAANTNRAIKLLEPYEYCMILNNDVEIKRVGWEYYYFLGMQQTGIHHFCFQQEGLWGAGTKKRPHVDQEVYNRRVRTIFDYPQGAILTYNKKVLEVVGYFDEENFRGYGRSHWDWSFRISESGIQPEGIHDLIGSNEYFQVHNEESVTPYNRRFEDYKRNTDILKKLREDKNRIYIGYV